MNIINSCSVFTFYIHGSIVYFWKRIYYWRYKIISVNISMIFRVKLYIKYFLGTKHIVIYLAGSNLWPHSDVLPVIKGLN